MRFMLALTLLLAPAGGSDGGEELLRALEERVRGISDFRAHFVQTYRSGRFGREHSERGVLTVKRPAMGRWEYRHPERKTAILTPEGQTFLYLPEERQVHMGKLDRDELPLPLAVLTGERSLLDSFEVVEFRDGPEVAFVKLVPREADPSIDSLVLNVGRDPVQILGLVVGDTSGSETEYLLSRIRENVGVGEEIFAFEIPRGVEVIEEEKPDPAESRRP
jgi:chaperone LolA